MNPQVKVLLYTIGGRAIDYLFAQMTTPRPRVERQIETLDKAIASLPADDSPVAMAPTTPESRNEAVLEEPQGEQQTGEDIATACVPCAIGHFAGAGKLLSEAMRFRDEGMESNQVIDDIAGAIGELNAMERVDLTRERLSRTPAWEREIAEDALAQSRKLRHRLEGITTIEEVDKAAADTAGYYKQLNRRWYRERFRHIGGDKAEAIASRTGGG